MNHKELKKQILIELNTILEMSISEVEKANKKTMVELLGIQWNYRAKNSTVSEVLNYNSEHLPENWEIKHEQLAFSFPGAMAYDIVKMVKNGFSDGIEQKHKEKTKKQQDYSGKQLQEFIVNLRNAYQSKDGCTFTRDYRSKTWYKETVIEMYEKSKPTDLIRLCWKFITDPQELEGIHYHWENPVAKYEPFEVREAA